MREGEWRDEKGSRRGGKYKIKRNTMIFPILFLPCLYNLFGIPIIMCPTKNTVVLFFFLLFYSLLHQTVPCAVCSRGKL
jgi:hypothetical protein